MQGVTRHPYHFFDVVVGRFCEMGDIFGRTLSVELLYFYDDGEGVAWC